MVCDTISRLPLYASVIPGAEKIAAAYFSQKPQAAPCEVRLKSYAQKKDGDRRFEVHFHTIDLMIASEGAEVIHLCPADRILAAEDLPDGADGRKLDGLPQGTAVLLEEGCFCAIFPGEAHMVGGLCPKKPGNISKWVLKIPCPDDFAVRP